MIYPNSSSEKSLITFFETFKILGIAKLLRQAGIKKHSGVSTYEAFQTLILLVFQGKILYQFLHSKRRDQIASKNTYYRFLNDNTFNCRRFLLSLVAIALIQNALKAGIMADYVLMDTWFTTESMIKNVLAEDLHVISMVKQLKH